MDFEYLVPFRGPPRYNPRRRSGLGWQLSPPSSHLHHLYIQQQQQQQQQSTLQHHQQNNHHNHFHHQQSSSSPPIHYHQQNSMYSDHSGPGSIISTGSLLSTLTSRNSLCIIGGPPSPCPSEHMPYSSASSSLSEGSSGHRSHEDDISIVTGKVLLSFSKTCMFHIIYASVHVSFSLVCWVEEGKFFFKYKLLENRSKS